MSLHVGHRQREGAHLPLDTEGDSRSMPEGPLRHGDPAPSNIAPLTWLLI